MNASDREQKSAWKARQRQAAQTDFPMSDPLMESLFETVEARIAAQGCDHTLRATSEWVAEHHQAEDAVLGWLKEHGGFCDCEVIANAADHWEQNR